MMEKIKEKKRNQTVRSARSTKVFLSTQSMPYDTGNHLLTYLLFKIFFLHSSFSLISFFKWIFARLENRRNLNKTSQKKVFEGKIWKVKKARRNEDRRKQAILKILFWNVPDAELFMDGKKRRHRLDISSSGVHAINSLETIVVKVMCTYTPLFLSLVFLSLRIFLLLSLATHTRARFPASW